jgi:cobaltochelatase CobN
MGTAPEYFDYISDGSSNDTICNYLNNMGTDGEGLENAEKLLIYFASNGSELLRTLIPDDTNIGSNEFLFILGTEFNELALNNAALNSNISSELNITIFTPANPVPEGFDFSNYGVIFIESQDESVINGWTSSLSSATAGGAKVIGFNLPPTSPCQMLTCIQMNTRI